MISKQLLQVIAINCDKAQKGKVYLTTIDKDLQYMGEQSLKKYNYQHAQLLLL